MIFAVFLVLSFLSGFAALVYQVVWQRMLTLFSGTDVASATMIVAAYMAGLGFGSLAGGEIADRVTARGRFAWFVAAELAIALFAASSDWLYYDQLHLRHGDLAGSPAMLAVILFASFLWPTFFMGMSLPLLARSLTSRIQTAPARIGALYAANTLGAAGGALATAWFLLRTRDFPQVLDLGAMLNVAVAVGALAAGSWAARSAAAPAASPRAAAASQPGTHTLGFRAWLACYALAGFIGLSWEIVWFRLLGVVLKSSSFTFPTLLAIYLGGLALGAAAGIVWAHHSRHPARAFFALQAAVTLYAGSILALGVAQLGKRGAGRLWDYLGSYEPLDLTAAVGELSAWLAGAGPFPSRLVLLYGVVPALLIGPPTFMMGASFPLLQKSVQSDPALLGRRVGWLQAANIAGSVAGALAVGALALTRLGTSRTVQLLVAAGGFFLFLWVRERFPRPGRLRRPAALTAAALLAALIAAVPSHSLLWARLHGAEPDRVISGEDGSGVSVLKNERPDFSAATTVYANGIGQSEIPYGGVHSQLGALPAMVHPDPHEIAVVGLGSGDTLYAAAGRPETREVTCIEIVAAQHHTLEELRRRSSYAGLHALLADPRIRFAFTDGRTYLRLNRRRYDIIEADALRPTSAYAGNLYSYEYFKLLQEHLKPGGFAVSWGASLRVTRTFVKAFPYVLGLGQVLIGSLEEIPFDPEVIRQRISRPAVVEYYRRAGVDLASLLEGVFKQEAWLLRPDHDRSAIVDINRDLFPKDEYRVGVR